MIKKLIFIIFLVLFLGISFFLVLNIFQNNPKVINSLVETKIKRVDTEDFSDWLWQINREFNFKILYMGFFSPGMLNLRIAASSSSYKMPTYMLEAVVKPNELIQQRYNSKIVLFSVVDANSKLS
ncbi:hypothetical protein ACFL96_10245, partial [Thermoproteota archaeon]